MIYESVSLRKTCYIVIMVQLRWTYSLVRRSIRWASRIPYTSAEVEGGGKTAESHVPKVNYACRRGREKSC